MEEQRIGLMYLNLFKRWLAGRWDRLFPRGLRRSSALPAMIVVALIGLPSLGYYLHMRGQFSTLKRQIKGEAQGVPVAPARPGGADPVVLTRAQTPGSDMPEFRSMTILPGLGMGVLQITASLPNRGEVALLAAPSVEELANGSSTARSGANDVHGAIEVPWGGLLTGLLTPLGTTMRASWRGNTLEAPLDAPGRGVASGGLLALLSADSAQTMPQPTGPVAGGTFHAKDFNQRWISSTDVAVSVALGASAIDVTVTAKNVGDQPEPLGIGWHPRFVIPSGDRDGAELRLPGGDALELDSRGLPSGKIVAPGAGLQRFQGHSARLGADSLDHTLTHLRPALLDTGAVAELRDPASGFGVRMTASPSIVRAFRVYSPAGASYVSLGTQTNFDDPLGREWSAAGGPAIATLLPGQTAELRLRLEIFSVAGR